MSVNSFRGHSKFRSYQMTSKRRAFATITSNNDCASALKNYGVGNVATYNNADDKTEEGLHEDHF